MIKTILCQVQNATAFTQRQDGAVTVDWVVLTAAMVVMVTGVFLVINEGVVTNASAGIAAHVEEAGTR